MKRMIVLCSLAGMLTIICARSANAQQALSWELRAGADIPAQELGEAELNNGYGFDGMLAYWFSPFSSIYGGWGWHHFSSEGTFAGGNMDFIESGYSFGLEITLPIGSSEHGFYVRGGGLYSQLKVEEQGGNLSGDSGHGLGWQAEGGLAFHLGNRWVLKPGVRYRSLSDNITLEGGATDFDLQYLNLSVGLIRNF